MADKKISELDLASSVNDADIFPIVQNSANKRLSFAAIKNAITGAVMKLTGYVIPDTSNTISQTMTVNQAIGSLERAKNTINDSFASHAGNSSIHTSTAERTATANHIANGDIHTDATTKTNNANHLANSSIHTSTAERQVFRSRIIDCTCTYNSSTKIFALVKINTEDYDSGMFSVRFLAPASYVSGAKFMLNGTTYDPYYIDNDAAVDDEAFLANRVVMLTFYKT